MGDPVDDDRVRHGIIHASAAESNELGFDADIASANLIDEGRGKRPLAANEEANLGHRRYRVRADCDLRPATCDLRPTTYDLGGRGSSQFAARSCLSHAH